MAVTSADQAMLDASPAPALASPVPVAAAPVLAPIPVPALPSGVEGPPAPPTPVDMPVALPVVAPAAVSAVPVAPVPPELQGIADATKAQQDAAGAEGDAKAAQSEQNAQAYDDGRVQEQAQAQEAADLRAEHSRAAQRASEQTQRALIDARDAKIPDFWAGREGARTNAALWAGLGGAAAGLLGSSKNGAADIIQSNVDGYYARQKERIDNLFKYAKGVGEQEDNVRLRQAAELAELQVQHGATNLAIADHIKQIEAASQGRVDIAAAQSLQADLAAKGQAAILAGRETLARIGLQGAQAARAAAKARAAAGTGGGGAVDGAIGLTQAIEKGLTGPDGQRRELTQSEMQQAAKDNHVKLNGKPSETTLATILANGTKFRKDMASLADEANKQTDEANKQAGTDPKNAYMEGGKVVGYVPSGRGGAAAFGARVVKYNTAVRALTELEQRARNATGGSIPWGPEFHSAVLAIASTTQAGSTDKNVAHEEGTLKGPLGLVSADAIDRKIQELKTQLGEFKSQLIPVSKGGGARDEGKIGRAKAVANLATATAAQKANANAYLHSVGESP